MKNNLMISILCFYISVQIIADDEEKHWPPMPPVPKTVDRSKHTRYGKPIQLFTAEQRKDLFDGVTVIKADVLNLSGEKRKLVAIPYYAWSHRGPGEMAVWLMRNTDLSDLC